jgi:hypothetical protein
MRAEAAGTVRSGPAAIAALLSAELMGLRQAAQRKYDPGPPPRSEGNNFGDNYLLPGSRPGRFQEKTSQLF